MPSDALGDLSVPIAQGLGVPTGSMRLAIEKLFGERYQKRHLEPASIRDAYALATEAGDGGVHQILAYASLFDVPELRAILVYPLREDTWRTLHDRGRDVSVAEIFSGHRRVQLELRGVPFGAAA